MDYIFAGPPNVHAFVNQNAINVSLVAGDVPPANPPAQTTAQAAVCGACLGGNHSMRVEIECTGDIANLNLDEPFPLLAWDNVKSGAAVDWSRNNSEDLVGAFHQKGALDRALLSFTTKIEDAIPDLVRAFVPSSQFVKAGSLNFTVKYYALCAY